MAAAMAVADLMDTAAGGFIPESPYDLADALVLLPQLFEYLVTNFRQLSEWVDASHLGEGTETGSQVGELAASMSYAQGKAGELNDDFRRQHRIWLAGRAS
jgi:hypothetical protein